MSDKFEYTYSAPTEAERKEIENIRGEYAPQGAKLTDLEKLRKLDKTVKTPPLILALSLGILGALVFGLGITFAIEWQNHVVGIPVGIFGMAVMVANPFCYKAFLRRRKQKYGKEILALSDKLLSEEKISD